MPHAPRAGLCWDCVEASTQAHPPTKDPPTGFFPSSFFSSSDPGPGRWKSRLTTDMGWCLSPCELMQLFLNREKGSPSRGASTSRRQGSGPWHGDAAQYTRGKDSLTHQMKWFAVSLSRPLPLPVPRPRPHTPFASMSPPTPSRQSTQRLGHHPLLSGTEGTRQGRHRQSHSPVTVDP